MKKLVALLLAGAMVISMVACGNGGNDKNETKAPQQTKEDANKGDDNTGDEAWEGILGVRSWICTRLIIPVLIST